MNEKKTIWKMILFYSFGFNLRKWNCSTDMDVNEVQ